MGVPVSLAGAKLVSEQILEDLKLPIPWKVQSQAEETIHSKSLGLDPQSPHSANTLDTHCANLRKRFGITYMEMTAWVLGVLCLCVAIFGAFGTSSFNSGLMLQFMV